MYQLNSMFHQEKSERTLNVLFCAILLFVSLFWLYEVLFCGLPKREWFMGLLAFTLLLQRLEVLIQGKEELSRESLRTIERERDSCTYGVSMILLLLVMTWFYFKQVPVPADSVWLLLFVLFSVFQALHLGFHIYFIRNGTKTGASEKKTDGAGNLPSDE